MHKLGRWLTVCLVLAGGGAALAAPSDDEDPEEWREAQWVLPASSKPSALLAVDVGPAEPNRFAIDRASIAVGGDGVVRYMMVVTTSSGATTISFEGIRCTSRERRIYAFGRADGTWSKSTRARWDRLDLRAINGYALTLAKQFFCPNGYPVRDVAEAIDALQRGGHPELIQK